MNAEQLIDQYLEGETPARPPTELVRLQKKSGGSFQSTIGTSWRFKFKSESDAEDFLASVKKLSKYSASQPAPNKVDVSSAVNEFLFKKGFLLKQKGKELYWSSGSGRFKWGPKKGEGKSKPHVYKSEKDAEHTLQAILKLPGSKKPDMEIVKS